MAPLIITVLGEGSPPRQCFRRWLVVRREKSDSLLKQEWYNSHLWLLHQQAFSWER